ncbi:hypothetical protein ACIQAA_16075 [Neobacillus sp. NPDC093182]|uniref:hypothetical protein n=1 Tax=Neobacillus sp. NPDC093182 TaxID=3364297 RepID=UPI0038098C57
MKRIFFSLLVLFFLAACSNEASFKDRRSQLPDDIISAIEPLPDKTKDQILIPSKLLSENYTVDFGYASEPVNDPNGNIMLSYIIYADKNSDWNITFNTYHNPSFPSHDSKNKETVKLKNGIEATYSETKNGLQRTILWKDDDITHEIFLIENPERSKPKYTKEEFLEVVNALK